MQRTTTLKRFLVVCIPVIVIFPSFAQAQAVLSSADLAPLVGTWNGSLTYLDYSTGKPYTMAANLVVTQIGTTNTFLFSNQYPNEPGANETDSVKLSEDGTVFDQEQIVRRTKQAANTLSFITIGHGTDGNDNKPATFRHTYVLGKSVLKIMKDVTSPGDSSWVQRHAYSYTR